MELVLDKERPLRGYTLKDHILETLLMKEDYEWWNGNEEDFIEICRRRRWRKSFRHILAVVVDSLKRWNSDDEEDSIKVYKRRHARKTRTVALLLTRSAVMNEGRTQSRPVTTI